MPHCISKNKHNFLSSLDFSLQFLPHRSHNLLPALAVNYNDCMVISSTNLQSHSLRTSPTLLSVCSSRSKRWSSFTRSWVDALLSSPAHTHNLSISPHFPRQTFSPPSSVANLYVFSLASPALLTRGNLFKHQINIRTHASIQVCACPSLTL